MIPNHAQFVEALKDKKKVRARFHSKNERNALERICAPMAYGPGGEMNDGLSRYWLWDYPSAGGACALGLLPQQIQDLQILGEGFDPAEFTTTPASTSVAETDGLPPAPVASDGGPPNPGL